ncbi:MAG: transcriptional regulator [Nitriliruptorales bacterium]|nr:transcriptional regulator [Nitriliruptorales bacterium]
MSTAEALVAANRDLWTRIATHPFVRATADGSLPRETFDRWLVEDHFFVVGFRRFLGRLLELAPDEPARDVLAGGLAALAPELELFRREAAARGLDLGSEPCPTNLGYTAFCQAAPSDGFVVGLTVLYGAESAYLDAWTAVRERAAASSPYWGFIDNWSSSAFRAYVADLAALLDRVTDGAPGHAEQRAFSRVVRFELRFWHAVHAGERWEDDPGRATPR